MNSMRILINGEERTRDIKSYSFEDFGEKVTIWFNGRNSHKGYPYARRNVVIEPVIDREILGNELVIHKKKIIAHINSYTQIGDGSDASVEIVTNGQKIYYKKKNIRIELLQEQKIADNELVLIGGRISEVESLYFSENFAKVKYKGKEEVYQFEKERIGFEQHFNSNFKDVMSYYKEIARVKDQKIAKEAEGYLEKQLESIHIRKDDSLYAFLNQQNKSFSSSSEQTIYPFGINLSQRDAINKAFSNRISLIQGPPGTGKTRSILNILANLVVQNKTAAVVSSNNEAVKNVIEGLEKHDFGFLAALLGNKQNKDNFFNNQKEYPAILAEWKRDIVKREELLEQIGEHENKVVSLLGDNNRVLELETELNEYRHEQTFFIEYFKKQETQKLKNFRFFTLDSGDVLKLLMDLEHANAKGSSAFRKIKYLFKYGIFDFKQYGNLEPIIIDLQNTYYDRKINDLNKEILDLKSNLENNDFKAELSELTEKSKEYFRAYLSERYANKERGKYNPKTYLHDNNYNCFISNYPIILSTTHAISKSKNKGYTFDYLIVDEASQVELVPGVIALSTAKNAVIVGDIKQLPHIPEESIKKEQWSLWHEKYGVTNEYDYVKQNLLSSFESLFGAKETSTLLKEHYRCHHKIISFCNQKYYDGKLVCYSKSEAENPLVLLKTVAGNHMRYATRTTNKITNIRELESLADEKFKNDLKLDFEGEKSFGFIAPFRGQAVVAETILPSEFQKDTVHKFQGRECDIVMFSSVLDKKQNYKYLLKFVDDPHLINVAVSRAKEKFILVSGVDVFKEAKGEISDLIRYMEYHEEDSILYQSKVRSIFDLLYKDYAAVLEQKRLTTLWGKSRYDSENLTQELIAEILSDPIYKSYDFTPQVRLKELFRDVSGLKDEEQRYIKNNASVDFVIHNKFDKQMVIGIEVDGFDSHKNNPKQTERDEKKNRIFEAFDIPLIRLPTNHANEKEKIMFALKILDEQ